MRVGDIMQTRVVTVAPETSLLEATTLMQARGIRHLPVVRDGALVGIISDRDLKRAIGLSAAMLAASSFAMMTEGPTVEAIMTSAVIVASPTLPVEEAARIMSREKISALPVTEDGRLVGIVTETDVLELLVRVLGVSEPSSRLEVALGPGRSALAEVVGIVAGAGVSIASLVTLARPDGAKEAVLRVATTDPTRAIAALEARGYAVTAPLGR